jgi:hypothetical protein
MDRIIRIRAEQLRKKLINGNTSPVFRDILDSLSDAELVAQSDAHHALKLEWMKEDAQKGIDHA